MTPEQFLEKWSRSDRTERQAAQDFIKLCRVPREATPNGAIGSGGMHWCMGSTGDSYYEDVDWMKAERVIVPAH